MAATRIFRSGEGDERSHLPDKWYTERPFVVSGVALAFVAVLGVFLLLHDGRTGTNQKASPPASTAPPAALATSEVPNVAPKGTTWTLWYGIALPSLPGSPAHVDNDIPDGYAHTPEGALIAASQLAFRTMFGSQSQQVAEKYTTGPNRDAYIAKLAASSDRTDTNGASQLAGFRFVSYSAEQAVIELVASGSPYQASDFTLLWIDNDWRILIGPNNVAGSDPVQVRNLNGYALWTGVAQ